MKIEKDNKKEPTLEENKSLFNEATDMDKWYTPEEAEKILFQAMEEISAKMNQQNVNQN